MESVTLTYTEQAQAALQAWLDEKRQLPIPPSVFGRLMELGRCPNSSPNDYAEVISTSASLAGRLLAAVNSSWFGVRYPVRNVCQAANLLGTVNVRVLAVTHCVAAAHEDVHLDKTILDRHWQACLIKAVAAEYLACQLDRPSADEAFLLGLMQDMVLPVMYELDARVYDRGLTAWSPAEQCRAERQRFLMDHAQAASVLAERFGLPTALCGLLRLHHDAEALEKQADRPALAEAVRFAGLFPHGFAGWDGQEAQGVAQVIRETFAGRHSSVDDVLAEIQRRFNDVVEYVRPSAAREVDLPNLLRQATGEVADTTVALVAQVQSLMASAVQVDSQLAAASVETIQLQEKTQQDGLTGLLNRRGLDATGQRLTELARQSGKPLAVLFADVDKFKFINDRFGHAVGDRVLRHVAHLLLETFGPSAAVARYGGDEFVVVLPDATAARQAKALAVGLVDAVAQGLGEQAEELNIPMSISVGGLWCRQVSGPMNWPRLLSTADRLMYQAKQQADSRVVFTEVAVTDA